MADVETKHYRAKKGAIAVVVTGFLLTAIAHPVLLMRLSSSQSVMLGFLLLGLLGPILVFAGFMGLYTYYENIEEQRYLPSEQRNAGVGSSMDQSGEGHMPL